MARSLIRVIKKLTPLPVKQRARQVEAQMRSLRAKFRCPVCSSRVLAFESLPSFYSENLQKHGWPFTIADAETCNDKGYQCPYCYASDRDRLYALYLNDYLTREVNFKSSILDFAPSAPLSDFIRRHISKSGKEISYRTADAFAEGVDDRVDITGL